MKTDYLQIFISFGITKLATNHSLRVSHFPQNNKVLRKVSSKMVLIDWNHDLWQFKYEIDNHLLFWKKMLVPIWLCRHYQPHFFDQAASLTINNMCVRSINGSPRKQSFYPCILYWCTFYQCISYRCIFGGDL